ncbi:MAG: hypothetical protein ACOC6Q_02550 [Patescibacteria group bacterium]
MAYGKIPVYLGGSIFGGGPSRRGSSINFDHENGEAHVSHWANYGKGDKGVRVSWDVGRNGDVSNVHGTDQNDNSRL